MSLTPNFKTKDPSASLVYDMDWGTHWLAVGVTIPTSTWTIQDVSTVAAWSGVTAYVIGDKALSGGVLYRSILASTNQLPTNATYWVVIDASPLTKDQEIIVTGNRITRVRLNAGTSGVRYVVTNRIVTNETPSQTDERSFQLLVQDL